MVYLKTKQTLHLVPEEHDEDLKIQTPIPSDYALRKFARFIKKTLGSQDILLECRPAQKTRGNKVWEIELLLFHRYFRVGQYLIGTKLKGFVACHKTGTFTTYCVSIEDREFWFDQFELALCSFTLFS